MALRWHGDEINRNLSEAVAEGLYLTAEQILTEAKQRTPQDTGTLRRSGTLTFDTPAAIDGSWGQKKGKKIWLLRTPYQRGGLSGKYSYAVNNNFVAFNTEYMSIQKKQKVGSFNFKRIYISFNTPYAHRVHEDLTARHTIGEAKFLERAYNLKVKNFEKNIAFAVRKRLK